MLGFSGFVFAQENIVVTGIVTDTNKEPMIGVNVSVADMPGLGAITDINGKYSLRHLRIIKSCFHISVMRSWKYW